MFYLNTGFFNIPYKFWDLEKKIVSQEEFEEEVLVIMETDRRYLWVYDDQYNRYLVYMTGWKTGIEFVVK